jgi:hypothetical protein
MFKTWCGRVFFLCENLPKGGTYADFWQRISFKERQVAKFLPFKLFWATGLSTFADREVTAGMSL